MPRRTMLIVALMLLASCSRTAPRAPVVDGIELSAAAAARDAQADLRAGDAKIYLAGTIALYEPGVDESNRHWVASLPRSYALSAGCTEMHAPGAVVYAETYNGAIVAGRRRSVLQMPYACWAPPSP